MLKVSREGDLHELLVEEVSAELFHAHQYLHYCVEVTEVAWVVKADHSVGAEKFRLEGIYFAFYAGVIVPTRLFPNLNLLEASD